MPLLLACLALLVLAAPARAAVPHTVQPGETLWSIAAANGFTTRSLAAYNGLTETSPVVLDSTIMVPTEAEAAAALAGAVAATGGAAAPPASAAPGPMGAYTVQAGDTLSGLAARTGVSVEQMGWMNGIDPAAPIVVGTSLKLPSGAPIAAPAAAPAAPVPVAPASGPQATGGALSGDEIGAVAAAQGADPALVKAVAWQEAGFNNSLVSSAGARGIMQVMPGTWDWVQDNLSGPLDPASPQDNVKAGSLYLNRLLEMSGGDVSTAVAGYYQGLGSVRSRGLFDDTRRYVDNVLALRSRFGG